MVLIKYIQQTIGKYSLSEHVPYVYRTHHQSDQVKGLDQERARSASKKSEARIEATKEPKVA